MVSYCVGLASVFNITSLYLLSCLQVYYISVFISVLLFKQLSLLYVTIPISHLSIKGSVWIVRMTYSDNFPCNFWCSIVLFDFPKFLR